MPRKIRKGAYSIWLHICSNHRKNKKVVCNEWLQSFETFLNDMKERPTKRQSLLKKDKTKEYRKENCYWGYSSVQEAYLHLVEINGVIKTAEQWGEELDISKELIYRRYHDGERGETILRPKEQISNNKEWCLQEAKKYKTRTEFKVNSGGAYSFLRRIGLIELACSHMARQGNHFLRYVYSIRLENKIYVGLTCNLEQRLKSHILKGTKAVKELIACGAKMEKLTEPLPKEEAAKKEIELVKFYKDNGFTIINEVKAGGLGSDWRIWTPQKVIEEGKKYSTIKEFRTNCRGAHAAMIRFKNKDEVCAHMFRGKRKPWTKEELIIIAAKYTSIKDFIKNDILAYNQLGVLGLREEITRNMKRANISWTETLIREKLRECKNYDDFYSKYSGACHLARKLKINLISFYKEREINQP